MSNPSSPPYFATFFAKATKAKKATKGIHRFRKLFNGLPFEASGHSSLCELRMTGTEAKNGGDGAGVFSGVLR